MDTAGASAPGFVYAVGSPRCTSDPAGGELWSQASVVRAAPSPGGSARVLFVGDMGESPRDTPPSEHHWQMPRPVEVVDAMTLEASRRASAEQSNTGRIGGGCLGCLGIRSLRFSTHVPRAHVRTWGNASCVRRSKRIRPGLCCRPLTASKRQRARVLLQASGGGYDAVWHIGDLSTCRNRTTSTRYPQPQPAVKGGLEHVSQQSRDTPQPFKGQDPAVWRSGWLVFDLCERRQALAPPCKELAGCGAANTRTNAHTHTRTHAHTHAAVPWPPHSPRNPRAVPPSRGTARLRHRLHVHLGRVHGASPAPGARHAVLHLAREPRAGGPAVGHNPPGRRLRGRVRGPVQLPLHPTGRGRAVKARPGRFKGTIVGLALAFCCCVVRVLRRVFGVVCASVIAVCCMCVLV